MDGRIVIASVIGFGVGAAASAGVTYILVKKKCDQETQVAIDQMKEYYKEKEPKKDDKEEKKEEDFVHKDKPDISEMSSIINSDNSDNSRRTHYSMDVNKVGDLKDELKKELEKAKEITDRMTSGTMTVVNYDIYNEMLAEGYLECEFTYNVDEEAWRDWNSDVEYDIADLPFDPAIVQWNDNEQCYICDRENKTMYMLEKV